MLMVVTSLRQGRAASMDFDEGHCMFCGLVRRAGSKAGALGTSGRPLQHCEGRRGAQRAGRGGDVAAVKADQYFQSEMVGCPTWMDDDGGQPRPAMGDASGDGYIESTRRFGNDCHGRDRSVIHVRGPLHTFSARQRTPCMESVYNATSRWFVWGGPVLWQFHAPRMQQAHHFAFHIHRDKPLLQTLCIQASNWII